MPQPRNAAPAPRTDQLLPLTVRAALAPTSINESARTIEVVFSTGARVLRDAWDLGRYWEELEVSARALNLDRLNAGAPVLAIHNQFDLDAVIGVVERAWIAGNEARALLRFAEDEESEKVWQKVRAGILRQVSAGYQRRKMEKVEEVVDGVPVYRVTLWEPAEISITPIAADAGAVTRAQGDVTMPHHQPSPTQASDNASREQRATEIRLSCRTAKLDDAFAETLIGSDLTLEAARSRIVEAWVAAGPSSINGHIEAGEDYTSPNWSLRAMSAAVSARILHQAPSEEARPFYSRRLTDLARDCLEARGIRTTFDGGPRLIERAMSSSDFPALLLDAGNRSLAAFYGAIPPGLRMVARRVENRDFRPRTNVRLSAAPELRKVLPGAEYTAGPMAESKEAYRVETFGRLVIFTRQAIVNDDLDAFSTVLQRMALAAVQFENRTLVDLLTSNPELDDGHNLFDDTNHHNLAVAAALSVDAIGAGRALLRLQQDLGSEEPMGLPPRYLVVPAALETEGEKLVTQIQATRAEDANPFSSRLEVVADPRLDGDSPIAWYLFADPALEPVIEYAYLEGFVGPFLETERDFDTDGLKSKVRLDFGAGIVGHRGAVRNPGDESTE